jgi:hypothetical protein
MSLGVRVAAGHSDGPDGRNALGTDGGHTDG